MGLSATHILLLLLVVVLLFGRGKISDLMGDVAKGIRSFKKGMAEDDDADVAAKAPKTLEQSAKTDSTSKSETTSSRS
ncbi:MAG: twin-arginine translocase TatA/TatE family subunit [Alphaproteobacteria bacterium]|nr:twin-arginine translocase TatA/TatE family subunit [Alphaproteobacteria bacterium]